MKPETTALLLIGYQNDYFAAAGALSQVIETSAPKVLGHTLATLDALAPTAVTLVSTPILFTPDYSELGEPVGILKAIKEAGAFRRDRPGGEVIAEFARYGDRILTVPGKRGLNAFSNTDLDRELRGRGIVDLVLLGVVTSLCIESTGREGFERGYRIHVLSDCTAGRTDFEQRFYCTEIFPMYAGVLDHRQLIERLS